MKAIDGAMEQPPISNRLGDRIGKVLIIAYKESTDLLEKTLREEGLTPEVMRQAENPAMQDFSSSYRCLLNHRSAWEKALNEPQPTLIIEADFVPVQGFGELPLPYPGDRTDLGIAWLYTCAPQIYSVSQEGYAQGFSTAMVAYIITNHSAEYLIKLAERIKDEIGPKNYSAWDSEIDAFLRKNKFNNYVPFRNYGEHGGRPNPEHRQNQLSSSHRADVLYGKLAFLPMYASEDHDGSFPVLGVRLKARLKGIGRLVTGRYLRLPILKQSNVPGRLLSFAIRRHLTLRL
ncbi:LPS biosynthesis glycosyltransferase [Laspinema olomoucense]|uniref:LPS biosynthesis glycosyltransferase n=1 Tax=Laspinema olomoucense TaxID=3231600 RepID=UPI0021BAC8E5|nr:MULTISPECIES: LPS biosynthesis glycosyltransferase [unclassified Laspinema]MCT7971040.1 LPS biosynthesis glycosyltransferase [Laspinema sp. D3d]MCT7996009.1 LPS biosynthesis glycosyltransferase [Laspinema sp. D3c]